MTVFLDLDGVLADFDLHVLTLWREPPGALELRGELWSRIEATGAAFWTTMPKTPKGFLLYSAVLIVTGEKPVILTGTPRSGREQADVGKRAWVATNLNPELEVITGPSRDKPKALRAPGDILVDDRIDNIRRWQEAGGVGVLWFNHPSFMENNMQRATAALRESAT